jgi:O-acetyl-ADP-ribose deacetylase (regulator of RNase III)
MKIIFADINKPVADALAAFFKDEPEVEVHHSDIFKHKAWAIVSPANSFGWMDGGIDLAYSMYFGWQLQKDLQKDIQEAFDGELLVGQAHLVRTKDESIPYMISAPTMRVPLHIEGTVNVYLAFRAALRIAKQTYMESILCPGLGTAVGAMNPVIAASQMKLAYMEVIKGHKIEQGSIEQANRNHRIIACEGGGVRLHAPVPPAGKLEDVVCPDDYTPLLENVVCDE